MYGHREQDKTNRYTGRLTDSCSNIVVYIHIYVVHIYIHRGILPAWKTPPLCSPKT